MGKDTEADGTGYTRVNTGEGRVYFYRKKYGMCGSEDAQKDDMYTVGSCLWWEDYGAATPLLQKLAIHILSQGAGFSIVSIWWSSFRRIASKKRNTKGK